MLVENLVAVVILLVLYFVPSVVALWRKVVNPAPAIIVNVCLGWSLIGWGVALYLACTATTATSGPSLSGSRMDAAWETPSRSVGHALETNAYGLSAHGNQVGLPQPETHAISHPKPWVFSCSCGRFSGPTMEAAEKHLRDPAASTAPPFSAGKTHRADYYSQDGEFYCQACGFTTTDAAYAQRHTLMQGQADDEGEAEVVQRMVPTIKTDAWDQLVGKASAAEVVPTSADFKTCPDCAEEVRAAARKCRFCGYVFADASTSA